MATQNDAYAVQVSQAGPFYDGSAVQRAVTGSYDTAMKDATIRAQVSYQGSNSYPFANARSGR
jgi:hypothetical protein